MNQISLLNHKHFVCTQDETILAAARRQGITLDHSCLDGRCASCKTRVDSGVSRAILEELSLTEEEKADGFILSCCRTAESDMSLEIEDLSDYQIPSSVTLPAKISTIEKLTNEISKVSLRLPPTKQFQFLPGQYIDVINGAIRRSYSVGSSSDNAEVDLIVKHYKGGEMSQYWFHEAKPNDLLRIEGPKGSFFFRTKNQFKTVVFLATGTGIAPIKSIFESEENKERLRSCDKVILLWGMKYEKDIFWKPEDNNFKVDFRPVLSREFETKRYVQDELKEIEIDLTQSCVYACGAIDMLNDCKTILVDRGLEPNQFLSDAFLPTN